jgi:1-acyl-sn-glycerol-3-phosphate acyltransferase
MKWQMVRLLMAGLPARMARLGRTAAEAAYAMWWWAAVAIAVLAGVAAIIVLPRLSWRWFAVRKLARWALAAVGASPIVTGADRIPGRGAVLMFNHASYADVLVLGAVLPDEPAYLAKREFAGQWLIGLLLRRLGVLFVERFELAGSLADIATAIAEAGRNRTLVVFPEGTFTARPGLSGFYLGGFKVAAEAGLSVLPGALRGTRTMLRSDQWVPRHASISVEIGDPIQSKGKDFTSVLRLRDSVRQVILARCGEPDVNELIKPPSLNSRKENE